MAVVRTTVAAVKATIPTRLEDAVIARYIEDAALWVDRRLMGRPGVTPEVAEAVERYLAAHLVAVGADPRLTSVRVGDVAETYARAGGEDGVTDYLRAAAAADPTGRVWRDWGPTRGAAAPHWKARRRRWSE